MLSRRWVKCLLVWCAAASAGAASADDLQLLKTFRAEFVAITPGHGKFPAAFEMGSGAEANEQPRHRVRLAGAFAVARYEVPQNLWQAVMHANPSRWQGPRNSVEMISWDDAVEFCRQVTAKLHAAMLIGPTQTVRLPTEAEWEYCTRAGSDTLYSFGASAAEIDDYAWSTRNAAGNDPAVGAKRPNPWGLHDVHGYLWEWCADTWHDTYRSARENGSAWTGANEPRRVLRGGSWKDTADRLTSSFRRPATRDLKDDAVGLRCVLASDP